jgi:hypothetical protein
MRRDVSPSQQRGSVGRTQAEIFPNKAKTDSEEKVLFVTALKSSAPTGDWKFILDTLEAYSRRNANNPASSILSNQMLLIATFSYNGRKEAGGWAGDFVLFVFMYAAKDIAADPGFWDNPPGTEKHRVWPAGSYGDYEFSAVTAGNFHFDKHLEPSFYEYVRKGFDRIISTSKPEDKMKDMIAFEKDVTAEHEAFINNAVKPAFSQVRVLGGALWGFERWFAKNDVAGRATALRHNTFDKVTLELTREGKITGDERIRLLAVAGLNVSPPF